MDKDLLTKLIDHLAYNRPMRRDKVIERLKEIVSSRATRELDLYQPLKVDLNEQEGELEIFSSKEVIEIVQNENSQIELQEAIKIKPDAKFGDILYVRVQPDLVKSLVPGVMRELYTGVSEDYPKREKNGRAQEGQKEENLNGINPGEKSGMLRQGLNDYLITERPRTRDLPHIPDLPEPKTPVSISVEMPEGVPDVEEPEGDTRDLISVLVNDRSNTKISENGKKSLPVSNDESGLNTESILSEIERVLMENGYPQVRRNFNELEVEVIKCNSPFKIIFHIYNEILSARSLLPFVKGVSLHLLILSGQADFISNVGIVLHNGKPCYVIKSTYPVKALTRSGLWAMVSQAILDASKANEIINSTKLV